MDIDLEDLDGESWDAQLWLADFQAASAKVKNGDRSAMAEVRELRSCVIEHTFQLVDSGGYRSPSGQWQDLMQTEKVIRGSRIYTSPLDASSVPAIPEGESVITVENKDCLLAAEELVRAGFNPAVLNMANRTTPGGGVLDGAGAQEENICRRSELYFALEHFSLPQAPVGYPMDRNHGGIYTPLATVFRATESTGYELMDSPFRVSFVSVPAINRPDLTPSGDLTPAMTAGTLNKIRTILRIALLHGHDSIVLSAFGCGAFRNPPHHIARLFHSTLKSPEFLNKFKRITFAIIEDHNSHHPHNPTGNFAPFLNEFSPN